MPQGENTQLNSTSLNFVLSFVLLNISLGPMTALEMFSKSDRFFSNSNIIELMRDFGLYLSFQSYSSFKSNKNSKLELKRFNHKIEHDR